MEKKEGKLNIGTKEWIILTIAIVALLNYMLLEDMQQLPSPIYGGDYWNHLGMVYHLYYGGSLFDNGQLAGEIPWVPWVYHIVILVISWITFMDPIDAVIWANIPLIFISGWLLYRIATRFTNNPVLIAAGLLPMLAAYPIFKYTDFAFLVIGPALLLAWLRYREKPDRNNMLLLMGTMIIANLSSTQLLIANYMVFGIIAANEVYKTFVKPKKLDQLTSPEGIKLLKPYIIIFVISFLGSLVYWYWPLFVYQGSTPNDLFIYGWADFTKISEQIDFLVNIMRNWFIPNVSWGGAYRLALLVGSILLIKSRMKNIAHETAFLFLIGALIGATHHFITFNLFQFHFDPERPFQMLEMPLTMVQVALAGQWLRQKIGKKHIVWAFLLVTAVMYNDGYTARENDQYYIAAKEPLVGPMAELKQWIIANTDVNDVFLTNNEDAFMMNGLTGRKSVSYRRTHTPIYTDMNQRMLDSAVMLYGADDATRQALLEKYNVKYVLWTIRWFDNQYYISPEGEIMGFFDPFMVPYKAEYQQYLDRNGIYYVQAHTYLDPAWQEKYPSYDVIVPLPTKGELFFPWHDGLHGKLKEVKRIDIADEQGNTIPFMIIYEVES